MNEQVAHSDLIKQSLEYMSQGVSVLDKNLSVVLYNQKFLEYLDFPEDFFYTGIPLKDVFSFNAERGDYGEGDVDQLVEERMQLARRFEPHCFERTRPNGVVLRISGTPLPDGGFITTYEDITKQKADEEELRIAKNTAEQANRVKSHFLANISHELRTPLNAIIGFSSLWRDQVFGPISQPKYLEYAEDIHHASTHLLDLIHDILDISQIESGRISLEDGRIDVAELIQDITSLFANTMATEGIKLTVKRDDPLPDLKGDQRRVKQMIINLVSNAVKFTKRGGEVSIEVCVDETGAVNIIIRDNGIGISEKENKDIFEPFTQVAESYSRSHEGVGLGLSIVQALMDEHGGRVALESVVGEGTVVRLVFPQQRSLGNT